MSVMHFCRNCSRGGLFGAAPPNLNKTTTLLACSRCKCTYYCSRACQVADYEKHKPVCASIVKMARVGQVGPSVEASFFFRLHYIRLMNEIYRVTHQYAIDKTDIIIELDFCPSAGQLCSPAVKGEFLVYNVQHVIEQQPPRDPSWYHPFRGTAKYDNWMSVYVERVRDIRNRITGNGMMTMVVNTSAGGSVGRFTLASRDGRSIFTSDEALQLFPVKNLVHAKLVLEQVGFEEYEILAQLSAFKSHGGGHLYKSG